MTELGGRMTWLPKVCVTLTGGHEVWIDVQRSIDLQLIPAPPPGAVSRQEAMGMIHKALLIESRPMQTLYTDDQRLVHIVPSSVLAISA